MEPPCLRETPAAAQGAHYPAERLWLALFLAGLGFCLLSIWLFDEPIARFFARHWRQYPLHGLRIGTSFVIAPIAAWLMILGILRLRDKTANRFSEALTVAVYSALSGFAINSFLLKVIFARERVDHFLRGHGGLFSRHQRRRLQLSLGPFGPGCHHSCHPLAILSPLVSAFKLRPWRS
jgi:hypothetical protein